MNYFINGVQLVCPYCNDHPELHYVSAQSYLHCPVCDQKYPEHNGKPCFLDFLAGEWGKAYHKNQSRGRLQVLLEKLYLALKAPRVQLSRRYNHFNLLRELAEKAEDYKALYIGYNQPFDDRFRKHIIELEVVPKEHVDVVAPGENLPFPDETFDLVVLSGVIEHTIKPFKVVQEIFRVLRNGGTFYISTPWIYPFHGSDNYRFSYQGLGKLCDFFSEVEIGSLDGPLHALAIFLNYMICERLSFGNRYLYNMISVFSSWFVFPLILLDAVFNKRTKSKYVLDANIYAIARK